MQCGPVGAWRLCTQLCALPAHLASSSGPNSQFWDAHSVWVQLEKGGYFPEGRPLPPALAAVREGGAGQAAAAHALGGCLSHLRDVLLDKQAGGSWVGGGWAGWGARAGAACCLLLLLLSWLVGVVLPRTPTHPLLP